MRFRPKSQRWKRTLQGWKLNISFINPPAITDTRITQRKENDTSIYKHQTVVKHLSNTNFLQNSFSHILQWWSRGALFRAQMLSAPKASVRKTKARPRSAALGGTKNFRILFLYFLKSNFVQSYPIIINWVAMEKFLTFCVIVLPSWTWLLAYVWHQTTRNWQIFLWMHV